MTQSTNNHHAPSTTRKRILLGQLVAFGDCLYATAIARQIKHDYPGCHLTWAIGSMCRSILDGNPYVDDIWEVSIQRISDVKKIWTIFAREATERKKRGDFDEIFLTQLAPGNLHNYDGTIRSSIFNAYPKPVTVPVTPVLRLSPSEIEHVRRFADAHGLNGRSPAILFESSPKSGQSCITQDFALAVAQKLTACSPDVRIILSSNIPFQPPHDRIIDGSVLSLRENAELTKYCSLLVGGSSGVSWIATSDWALPLPMIQIIRPDAQWFASFVRDHEQWGLPTNRLLEMTDCDTDNLVSCITAVLTSGFDSARASYHQRLPVTFHSYQAILVHLLLRGRFLTAARLIRTNIKRHGCRIQLFLPAGFLLSTLSSPFRRQRCC